MATIDDLAVSISELDEQAVFELIKKRRFSRRIEKASNKKAKRKAAKRKPKKKLNLADALGALSPEQKAKLLADLIGG